MHVFRLPPRKKAYKLLQHSDKKILISRDVVFHEDIFPYSASSTPIILFPPLPPYIDSDSSLPPSRSSSSPQESVIQSSTLSPSSTSSESHLSPVSPSHSPSHVLAARYPSRIHHSPSYLNDYLCSFSSYFPPSLTYIPASPRSVCFSTLSSRNQSLVHTLDTVLEPSTYQQPAWQEAMLKEFEVLEANGTWDVVPLPPGKKPIGCK